MWHPSKSGLYSVKSGYILAKSLNGPPIELQPSSFFSFLYDFWKNVWNLEVPPKFRHF